MVITVVEDSDFDVKLLDNALSAAGVECRIHRITDGEEARKYVSAFGDGEDSPRLIVLDLNLPRIDGLTILNQIRSNRALEAVPVIVWSSTMSPRDQHLAARLGAAEFIVKPVNLEEWMDLGIKLRRIILRQPAERDR